MDARKLDAALATMLDSADDADRPLPVFVRVAQGSAAAIAALKALGIDAEEGATVFAVDLSKRQVGRLSDESWIKTIRLARGARPIGGE